MPKTRRLLGSHGTTFATSIISFPLCCPSRATFLTGQYAHNHRVLSNHGPHGGFGSLDNQHTLPLWLLRAGYRTALVGKYLNGYGDDKDGGPTYIPPGWSDWTAILPEGKTSGYDYELNESGRVVHYGSAPSAYKTDVLAAKATKLVRDAAPATRPFFLWVTTDAPHTDPHAGKGAPRDPVPAPRDFGDYTGAELPPAPSYDDRNVSDKPRDIRTLKRINAKRRAGIDRTYVSQLESLESVDDLVAGLVATLRREGELGRTLIVFTSDNGYIRGQHRIAAGKSNVYEEALRVPLLIRGPGFPSGVSNRSVVANVDLAPTILAAAGAGDQADLPLDGEPLGPVAHGEDRRKAVLVEIFKAHGPDYRGVRTPRYLYAGRGSCEAELYDLRKDPYELANRIDDPSYRGVARRLAAETERLKDCSGSSCR